MVAVLFTAAPSVAVALDLSRPETLPLRPTAAEFGEILEASAGQARAQAVPRPDECRDAGFPTLQARATAVAAQDGDILAAYAHLCRQAALEARLKAQRISRSRCCGG